MQLQPGLGSFTSRVPSQSHEAPWALLQQGKLGTDQGINAISARSML